MAIEPIAVVGLAARVPDAADADGFWANLVSGRNSIHRLSRAQLLDAGESPAALAAPNYLPFRPLLDDPWGFDPAYFGMSRREAELRNPQHRLFLELCETALQSAGIVPGRGEDTIGVYGGCASDRFVEDHIRADPELLAQVGEMIALVSSNIDYLAPFVSYRLGLSGPSISVRTACSTSLVATHLACQALRAGDCDVALAGGVEIETPYGRGYLHIDGGIDSADGFCRPLDENASGTVFGSGGGVVALRRLTDARAAGDRVLAVIRGTAVNNDGAERAGFTAPSWEGQSMAVAEAIAVAGADPASISYVELHGTGTRVGDPIEIRGLHQAMLLTSSGELPAGSCAIGSVKSNLGHLGPASGVVGLIKTVLALHHELIPPTINVRRVNPALELDRTPFTAATSALPWPRTKGAPRRAGVSSFGFGGTNAHAVLEEAPPAEGPPPEPDPGPYLLTWSGTDDAARDEAGRALLTVLAGAAPEQVADISWTSRTGRRALASRAALRLPGPGEAAVRAAAGLLDGAVAAGPLPRETLTGETLPRETLAREALPREARPWPPLPEPPLAGQPPLARAPLTGLVTGSGGPRAAVLMFPGQGSQYPAMGRDAARFLPGFESGIRETLARFSAVLGIDLSRVWEQESDPAVLAATVHAQPLLYATGLAVARSLERLGLRPAMVLGHSIGELVAATLAGVLDEADGIRVVAERARLMQQMPPGQMLAVSAAAGDVAPLLTERVWISAVNHPAQTVVGGPPEAVAAFREVLAKYQIRYRELATSHAFHTPMMEPMTQAFTEMVASVKLSAPQVPMVSAMTGAPVGPDEAVQPEFWARQVTEPVRLAGALAHLPDGDPVLVEAGPGTALTGLARRHPAVAGAGCPVVPVLPGRAGRHVLDALGELWALGTGLDAGALPATGRRKHPLPAYPFRRVSLLLPDRTRRASPAAPTTPAAQTAPAAGGAPLTAAAPTGSAVRVTAQGPAGEQPGGAGLAHSDGENQACAGGVAGLPVAGTDQAGVLASGAGQLGAGHGLDGAGPDAGPDAGAEPVLAVPAWEPAGMLVPRRPAAPGSRGRAVVLYPADLEAAALVRDSLQIAGYRITAIRPGQRADTGPAWDGRASSLDAVLDSQGGVNATLLVHATGMGHAGQDSAVDAAATRAGAAGPGATRARTGRAAGVAGSGAAGSDEEFLLAVLAAHRYAARRGRRLPVLMLTDTGVAVTGAEPLAPARAAAAAIVRSAVLEGGAGTARMLDVAGTTARLLGGEIGAPSSGEPVLALRGQQAWRPGRLRLPLPDWAASLEPEGRYLITGGLGGVGLAMADGLAATGLRPHLILVSRSARRDGLDAATAAALDSLAECGATVSLEAGDAADRDGMAALLDRVTAEHGPVHGIIHAAGVAGGALLVNRDPAHAAAVLRPKVTGSVVLRELAEASGTVRFLALFSSRAALNGLVGSADYAAANAYMDALAQAGDAGRTRVISINWPTWHGVGMAAGPARPAPGRAGRSEAVRADAVQADAVQADAVQADAVQAGPGPDAVTWRTQVSPGDWLVAEHLLDGVPVVPATGIIDMLVRAVRSVAGDNGDAVELTDLTLATPLTVERGTEVEVALAPAAGGWRATVRSWPTGADGPVPGSTVPGSTVPGSTVPGSTVRTHVTAGAASRALPRPPRRDLLAESEGWPEVGAGARPGSRFRFGPRFDSVRQRRRGDDPEVTTGLLELAAEWEEDLEVHAVHPALLDRALALQLRPEEYIPFGYRRIVVYRDLPGQVITRHRLRADGDGRSVVDAVLTDGRGRTLVEVAGFVKVLLAAGRPPAAQPAAAQATAAQATARAAGTRRDAGIGLTTGVTAQQGVAAALRLLGEGAGSRAIVVPAREWDGAPALPAPARQAPALPAPLPLPPDGMAPAVMAPAMRAAVSVAEASPAPAPPDPPAAPAPAPAPASALAGTRQADGGQADGGQAGAGAGTRADTDEIAGEVVRVWAETLGLDGLTPASDFFGAGGDSLTAIQVISRLRDRFGVELSVFELFDTPTAAALAGAIAAKLGQAS